MASDDILEIIEIGLSLRLVEAGILDKTQAGDFVGRYIAEVRESYGGNRFMIRRGYRKYPDSKIQEIKKQFNGKNAAYLQGRFGISRSTLYRYLKK